MPVGVSMDAETVRKYSTWFIAYGVLLVIVGALAVLAPNVATLALEMLLGWILIVSGIFGLIAVGTAGASAPGFWWNLVTAIICLLAGIALLWHPVAGAITLTIILIAYLIATGVAKIAIALGYRTQIPKAWIWMLLSALIDIALGLLILSGLPGTAAWVLGLLVGINLIFTGVAVTMAAFAVRELGTTAKAA